MNRYQSLTIYAALIIVTSVLLLLLAYNSLIVIQYTVAIGMLLSTLFAFITAYKSLKFQVALKYHILHAGGMIVYSFAIMFLVHEVSQFLRITTFFLLYYGIAEIIFCLELLMMKYNVSMQTVGIRLFIGFVIALGATFILNTSYINQNKAILVSGGVLLLTGINLIMFKTILRRLDQSV